MQDFTAALTARREASLYRQRSVVSGMNSVTPVVNGDAMLSFSSNDYLGLAADERVVAALQQGAAQYGVGSGASHLTNGHTEAHHLLEEQLAAFTGRDRALLFSNGYMANLGILTTLMQRGDRILGDKLMHASLIDAATLSAAKLQRFAHNDLAQAERQLQTLSGNVLVVTEGVFSMDGDSPDLVTLAGHCKKHDAWLMVDDAHGIGVLGATGAGSTEAQGLGQDDIPVLMGTLGKAMGCFGAFVAGSDELIEMLIQHASSYIFTTALPSAVAVAASTALQICEQESWRREHLQDLVTQFRHEAVGLGLQLGNSLSPIQPIILGHADVALAWAEAMAVKGLYTVPIRPPTVPDGEARLRISFSASHQQQHLEQLLDALAKTQRLLAA